MNPWAKGLLGAMISGASGGVMAVGTDMATSPAFVFSFRRMGIIVLVTAIVGGAAYIKQSPFPPKT